MSQATLNKRASEKDAYLAAIAELQARDDAPVWLARIRNAASSRFERMRFPTTHDEDWKYTNVAPIMRAPFELGPSESATRADLASVAAPLQARSRLLFVDGVYQPDGSTPMHGRGRGEAFALNLDQAIEEGRDAVEAELGRHADSEGNAFVAMNTALFEDGAVIYVADGVVAEHPIVLQFVSTRGPERRATNPRVLVVLGRAAAATVVESYTSNGSGERLTNSVAEIVLGEGSSLKHYRVVEEGDRSFNIATTEVHQARDSVYEALSLTSGPAIGRHDLHVRLLGIGASCSLNGLSLGGGQQHVDSHTLIDHAEPHCSSRQLYKYVLDQSSRGVFNGKIVVRPGAQKTDAQQSNRNLLLSPQATVDTKPQLEIFADDVRCTHGATIGQLDEDMLFYLKSRGLGDDAARQILTIGFASDVLASVHDSEIRTYLQSVLRKGLDAADVEMSEASDGVVEDSSGKPSTSLEARGELDRVH